MAWFLLAILILNSPPVLGVEFVDYGQACGASQPDGPVGGDVASQPDGPGGGNGASQPNWPQGPGVSQGPVGGDGASQPNWSQGQGWSQGPGDLMEKGGPPESPESPGTWRGWSQEQDGASKWAESPESPDDGASQQTGNNKKKLEKALIFYFSGLYPQALALFDEIIGDKEEAEIKDWALFYGGSSLRLLNKYNEAEEYFNTLVKNMKNSSFMPMAKGELYIINSQLSPDGDNLYQLASDGDLTAHIEEGDRQFNRGDLNGAILAYQKAKALNPFYGIVDFKMGLTYYRICKENRSSTGTDYHKLAENCFRKAVENGGLDSARLNLGVLLAEKGERAQARQEWLEIIKKGPEHGLFERARENYRLSFFQEKDGARVPYIFLMGYNHFW